LEGEDPRFFRFSLGFPPEFIPVKAGTGMTDKRFPNSANNAGYVQLSSVIRG
jgi:hypothetical protein